MISEPPPKENTLLMPNEAWVFGVMANFEFRFISVAPGSIAVYFASR